MAISLKVCLTYKLMNKNKRNWNKSKKKKLNKKEMENNLHGFGFEIKL